MRPSFARFSVAILGVVVLAAPALAGGGAPTTELVAPPGEARVGQPLQIDFLVSTHGQPFTDVSPHLSARHQATEEMLQVDARRDSEPGRFSVDVSFPMPGRWNWEIVLEDWGATTFAPLDVLTTDGARIGTFPAAVTEPEVQLPAILLEGNCDVPGREVAALAELAMGPAEPGAAFLPDPPIGSEAAAPVKMSVTTVPVSFADLIDGGHAIVVQVDIEQEDAAVLCGEIGGRMIGRDLPFGLRPLDGSGLTGVAVLRAEGDRTTVTAYVTAPPLPLDGPPAAGPEELVEIRDYAFGPASITIAAGSTVTWTNFDPAGHSVAFDDMAFADSPMIFDGQAFSQTFDTPGTYAYHCSPHPDMLGTIVVT